MDQDMLLERQLRLPVGFTESRAEQPQLSCLLLSYAHPMRGGVVREPGVFAGFFQQRQQLDSWSGALPGGGSSAHEPCASFRGIQHFPEEWHKSRADLLGCATEEGWL